jgi:hypothetical protein
MSEFNLHDSLNKIMWNMFIVGVLSCLLFEMVVGMIIWLVVR